MRIAVAIGREGRLVTAQTFEGKVLRSHECRTTDGAIALEKELAGDPELALWWAHHEPERTR